tara:strand:+ start:353 stop:910 length:558 start_codon:yes stop_codon:yes gene_type:complete
MIYLIDHEDSFTFNLAHLLGQFDKVFVSNYYNINSKIIKKASIIVLSPGPGEPKDYNLTSKIYNKYKGIKKILGVCLGFQQIVFEEGGQIIRQNKIFHGYQSKIRVLQTSNIFKHNEIYKVGRYHSLKIKEPIFFKTMKITMRCIETKTAMAVEDNERKIYGFQFHPDSFLTDNGKFFIQKILSA